MSHSPLALHGDDHGCKPAKTVPEEGREQLPGAPVAPSNPGSQPRPRLPGWSDRVRSRVRTDRPRLDPGPRDMADTSPPQPTPVPAARGPVRVLVVDDNRDVADSAADLLRVVGFEVLARYDGSSALAAAGELR